ncbi:hypothetical protein SESBI_31742, partial [Sesbania bispinosa]
MCLASKHNNGEIEVFFEHPVIPDECVVFSKVAVDENTGEMAVDSGEELGAGDTDTSVEVVDEVTSEREELSHVEVVVEEAAEREEEDMMMFDSYESAVDSLYRPSPIVSEDDEEESPIVAEVRSKKKNDCAARNTDKGKNVMSSISGGKPKKARRKDGNEGSVHNNRLKRSCP